MENPIRSPMIIGWANGPSDVEDRVALDMPVTAPSQKRNASIVKDEVFWFDKITLWMVLALVNPTTVIC